MADATTILEDHELSPAARRTLEDPAKKMMVARGLLPLPDPRDLVSVLYQLAGDDDPAVRAAAHGTLAELPETIVSAALGDAQLPARVIDSFAAALATRDGLAAVALANPSIADDTVAKIAARANAAVCALCAENETRLLRCPEIVAALYTNPQAPMSMAAHAVELCARNDVRVPIAAWEEVAAAHIKVAVAEPQPQQAQQPSPPDEGPGWSPEEDAAFSRAAAAVTETVTDPSKDTPISALPMAMKVRLAAVGNATARAILIRDPARPVAMAAIKSPAIADSEVTRYAANTAISEDVISYIASRRDWVKLYAVKLALVSNPKTPLTAATRLLAHLRERDLKGVARSKSVPSALAAQAKKLITQRRRGP